MRVLSFILYLLLVAGNAAAAAEIKTEIYSEQVYLGREDVMGANLRVRAGTPIAPSLTAYLQAGTELLTATPLDRTLDTGGSYLYGGPGLRYTLGKVSLFAEARARQFYTNRVTPQSPQRNLDVRGLVVYSDFFQARLGADTSLYAFLEPYGEGLYTSGDLDNVIATGFVRAGARWKAGAHFNIDAYLEPFAVVDRVGHYYNNRADLKPSLRFQYYTGSFSLSFMASYVFNKYFSWGTFERNPYADRDSGVRVLTVVGGTF